MGETNGEHLNVPNSKVSPIGENWEVEKVAALKAISKLTPDNVLGYKKGDKTIFDKGTYWICTRRPSIQNR